MEETKNNINIDDDDCPICFEKMTNEKGTATTGCKHKFCTPCFARAMRKSNDCPLCRAKITPEDIGDRDEDGDSDIGGDEIHMTTNDVIMQGATDLLSVMMFGMQHSRPVMNSMEYYLNTPLPLTPTVQSILSEGERNAQSEYVDSIINNFFNSD